MGKSRTQIKESDLHLLGVKTGSLKHMLKRDVSSNDLGHFSLGPTAFPSAIREVFTLNNYQGEIMMISDPSSCFNKEIGHSLRRRLEKPLLMIRSVQ